MIASDNYTDITAVATYTAAEEPPEPTPVAPTHGGSVHILPRPTETVQDEEPAGEETAPAEPASGETGEQTAGTPEQTTPGAAEVTPVSFPDVAANAWYYEPVGYVGGTGLMVGYEDGAFRPEDSMNLAEYMTIMYRYLEQMIPSVGGQSTTGDNWKNGANWLNNILLNGQYEDLTAVMTRYDMATITYAALQAVAEQGGVFQTREIHGFTDVTPNSPYYAMLTYLESVSAIDGYAAADGSYTFQGENNIKRCEVAQVLYNFLTKQ